MTIAKTAPTGVRRNWTGPTVDVDVHATVPDASVLLPYLDPVWVQHITEQQWYGPSLAATYPPNMRLAARADWRPQDGRPPASDLAMIQRDVLDAGGADVAILTCLFPIDGGPPDFSVALARAVNDWLVEHWLEPEPRLRASLVLPGPNDPAAMAAEIDRMGSHSGFVQAILPARSGRLYGKRVFWPVFEALERSGIVGGIHFGGSNEGLAPTPSGFPSWVAEEYSAEVQIFQAQIISILGEGLFQRFPDLRLSFLESGFTWVPAWMWDLDRNWKGIRREVPWLDRRPFEVLRDHVRFSTAPLAASDPEDLAKVIGWLRSEEILMYASDYPHDHGDDLAVLLGALPEGVRGKVMSGNAREWYRLDGGTR
ncbi:amidohydrolase [Microbacterium sp. zg.B48]|uniref:amidohydrolase family protein n=1 Tax=Microbacterium sp. zg.B48 TaxID=2969408 RepID=UPI00214CEC46|nr:amidohydrolase family protein [Microbacterium sp. zg.B48]MCR2764342.1 amidohydrolase [Microbacterium sp. zg.B48]